MNDRNLTAEAADPVAYWEADRIGRGLRMWQAEVPEIDSRAKAVVGRVLHLQELMTERINRNLARFNLKFPSYAVIATLRVSGAPYRMSPGELLSRIVLSSGGLSNLLRRLEADGYIIRRADEHDARGVQVELTSKGIAVAEEAMRAHAVLEHELIGGLSAAEQESLSRLLAKAIVLNSAV